MLGIHAALQVMFSPGAEARDWLRHGRISGGERRRAPLDCITGGDLDDMMLVRRHLEAWCAGHVGAAGPAGAYEAVTEEMIDFR
ncbi:hypothetical protein [Wenxinia saemankumensis]|nr:hypothetical protein [Wenxinia saemankumensis]